MFLVNAQSFTARNYAFMYSKSIHANHYFVSMHFSNSDNSRIIFRSEKNSLRAQQASTGKDATRKVTTERVRG